MEVIDASGNAKPLIRRAGWSIENGVNDHMRFFAKTIQSEALDASRSA